MAVPNAVKDDSVIHAPRELVAPSGLLARTNAVMRTTAATVPANGRDERASRLDLERTHLATEVAAIPTEVTIAARQTAVAIHPKAVRRSPTGSRPITSGANVHWTPAKQGRFQNSRIAATEAAAGMLTPTKRLTQPIARTFAWVSRLLMRSPSAVEGPEDGRVATVVEGCPAEVGRFHVAPVPKIRRLLDGRGPGEFPPVTPMQSARASTGTSPPIPRHRLHQGTNSGTPQALSNGDAEAAVDDGGAVFSVRLPQTIDPPRRRPRIPALPRDSGLRGGGDGGI